MADGLAELSEQAKLLYFSCQAAPAGVQLCLQHIVLDGSIAVVWQLASNFRHKELVLTPNLPVPMVSTVIITMKRSLIMPMERPYFNSCL